MLLESTKINAKKRMNDNPEAGYYDFCLREEDANLQRNAIPYILPANVDFDQRYREFRKAPFAFVNGDISDHLLGSDSKFPPCAIPEEVDKEWDKLQKFVLTTDQRIFVRASTTRVSLLRAVIIGKIGTPYQHGLFFFDIRLSHIYPTEEPFVRYHSFGLQINPSIKTCGEMLMTRFFLDDDVRKWKSNESDIPKLLTNIRDDYLSENPLFNQEAYRNCPNESFLKVKSVLYNENIIIKSLNTMVFIMNKPPLHFEALVIGHFRSHATRILQTCEHYIKGGFLNDESKQFCSITFKNDVASCINPLIKAFVKIGVNKAEAEVFRHLSDSSFSIPVRPSLDPYTSQPTQETVQVSHAQTAPNQAHTAPNEAEGTSQTNARKMNTRGIPKPQGFYNERAKGKGKGK